MSQPNDVAAAAVALLSYTRPDTEVKKVMRTVTKRIDDMTAEEVLLAYQQNVPQDWEPTPEQKAQDELYALPMDQLLDKANAQMKAEHDAKVEAYRVQNVHTWLPTPGASRYKQTLTNAQTIINELNARNLDGSVMEIQNVYEDLAAKGKLELNYVPPSPAKVYTNQELSEMPLDQMAAAIEEMHRNGVI